MYLRTCEAGAAHLTHSPHWLPTLPERKLSSFSSPKLGLPCPLLHPFLLPPLAPLGPRWFSCSSRDKLGLIPQLQDNFTCCSLCLESPHVHRFFLTPFSVPLYPHPPWHLLRERFLTSPCCSGPRPASCSSRLLLLGNCLIGERLVFTTENVPWGTEGSGPMPVE